MAVGRDPSVPSNSHAVNTGVLHSGASDRKALLLKKIGGNDVLHEAVDRFYAKLVDHPDLQPFFRHANVEVLKWHQFNIMSIAFTSVPDSFSVSDLILGRHKNLFDQGLDESHYRIVIGLFEETLKELDVEPAVIEEAKAVVEPLGGIFRQGAEEAAERRRAAGLKRQVMAAILAGVLAIGIFRLMQRKS